MKVSQTGINVCRECKPVFKDGVQDMHYRHEACWDECERYNKQKEKAELRKADSRADDAYILNKVKRRKS